MTLAILLLGPLLAWTMDNVGRRYRRISHRIQESGAQLLQSADQALSNHQEVKVYGAQAAETRALSRPGQPPPAPEPEGRVHAQHLLGAGAADGRDRPGAAAVLRRSRGRRTAGSSAGDFVSADDVDAGDHPVAEAAHQRAGHAAARRRLGRAPVRRARYAATRSDTGTRAAGTRAQACSNSATSPRATRARRSRR